MSRLVLAADTVYTLAWPGGAVEPGPVPTAVLVEDGIIRAVGDRGDVDGWRDAGTEVVDLGAATLTPGLVDSHSHPIMGIAGTRGVALGGADSLDEVRARLAAEAQRSGEWVRAWGLDPNTFGAAPVTGDLFDDVLGGRALCAVLFDGHSGIVNRRARELAGITGERRFEAGGRIVVDERGEPTGLLLELEALKIVLAVLPPTSPQEMADGFVDTLSAMAATGITGLHAMDFEGEPVGLLEAIEAARDLPVRLRISPICAPGSDAERLEHLAALQGTGGRSWTVQGIKLFADGTVDNGTAWLHRPDVNGESTASVWPDPADYAAAVRFFASRGVPTATHAIGDEAVEYVLTTIESLGAPDPRVPHRVEHAETMPDALIDHFVRSGAVASMQASHCAHFTRADHTDNWSARLGDDRALRGWRIRDLVDRGVVTALGSDWPIAGFDIRAGLAESIVRRPSGRPDIAAVGPEQGLTPEQALRGYTSSAARAAGLHDVSGVIAPGMRADLTAFTVDPLRADADELAEAPIALTVVGGRIQHRG
jgi:predicted amidohydrolase YtcJ